MTSFAPIFVPDALREAVSDEARSAAMLDAERRSPAPSPRRENMTQDVYSERDRLGLEEAAHLGSAEAFGDRPLDHWREAP